MTVEFTDFWKAIQKWIPLILLISFGAGLVAFTVARNIPATHTVYFSYLVSLAETEDVPEFQFDGYYGLSATDLFAATLSRWVTTPEVIVAAYKEAGLVVLTDNSRELTSNVRADKTAPQLIEVAVSGKTQDEAERFAEGLRHVMDKNVKHYHDVGEPAARFSVVATDSWSGVSRVSVPVIVVTTFVMTLFLSINIVLFFIVMRKNE